MSIKSSNLYCYYVKNHNAIKVGYGDSSQQRMRDYAKVYSLEVDSKSLKSWNIPVSGLASIVESACHQSLLDAGFKRYIIPNADGQEAQELFDLGNTPYHEVVIIIAGTIDETIDLIANKITKTTNKEKEIANREFLENKARIDSLRRKKEAQFIQKSNDCAKYIRSVWKDKFQPFVDIFEKTRLINKNFVYKESALKRLFGSEKNPVIRMYNWPPYKDIRNHIIESFDIHREAKAELIKINNIFKDDDVIRKAIDISGLCIYSPNGHDLCLLNPYRNEDWAHLEIRLLVQFACYFGGDDASELIELDPILQSLVAKAWAELPPELT